jgi:hypothetical protein
MRIGSVKLVSPDETLYSVEGGKSDWTDGSVSTIHPGGGETDLIIDYYASTTPVVYIQNQAK